MSRRLAPVGVCAVLNLLFGLGAPLAAQSRQAEEAALLQRIDSLMPLYQQARQVEASEKTNKEAAAKVREHPTTDTIAVGPLRIVTLPGQTELARQMYS